MQFISYLKLVWEVNSSDSSSETGSRLDRLGMFACDGSRFGGFWFGARADKFFASSEFFRNH
eukprot:932892-Amorphochlora_amoeboformis.AAC.2